MDGSKEIIVITGDVNMDDACARQVFDSIKEQVAVVLSRTPLEFACPLIAQEVLKVAKASAIETVSLRWIVATFLECLQRYLWGDRLAPVYRLHSHGPVRFDEVVADVDHLMCLFEMEQMSVDETFEVLRTNGSMFPRQLRGSFDPTAASAPAWPDPFISTTLSALPTPIPFASTVCDNLSKANPLTAITAATPPPANEVSRPASFQQPPCSSTNFQEQGLLLLKSVKSKFNAVWKDVSSAVKDKGLAFDNLVDWKEASGPLFVRYELSELEDSDDILRSLDKIITDRLLSADSFVTRNWHDAHGVIIGLYLSLKSDTEDVAQAQDALDNWDLRFWASFQDKKERTQGLELQIRQSLE